MIQMIALRRRIQCIWLGWASAALFTLGAGLHPVCAQVSHTALRPPAVPLVTADPYLSIWSAADHLTDKNTTHWTGRDQPLLSLIRVDGQPYRIMGGNPNEVPPLPQVGLVVTPTRTTYEFEGSGVHVTLTFLTPLLPHDLEVMSRPVTYLTWDIHSTDAGTHSVQLFYATSGMLAVNKGEQAVTWSRETAGDLTLMKIGSQEQRMLANAGDDTRIDWGYAYTAVPAAQASSSNGGDVELLKSFIDSGKLPTSDEPSTPRPANTDQPLCATTFDLGSVGNQAVTRQVMLGYDEVQSIKYYGKPLPPFWRRDGATPSDLFQKAEHDYTSLVSRCDQFDKDLIADARKSGGDSYADIVALAYRQCWAGCGIAADSHKQPLLFTKENTSNGDIATVDVIFPMDPIWVLFSPALAKSSLAAVLNYSASSHWKFPSAPHDLGTYPIVGGRDDGGEGMPVEESGNMLILCDAIAQSDGNADWVKPWWPQLTQWAEYLKKYGLDPEEQLCTDDFMGHLAHNSNLSVKAILGLAAYGDLCKMRGETDLANQYQQTAKTDAEHWTKAAMDDSGDHYRLAFDKPNTWSQKYNLVWDKVLGLNVFPAEVAQKEVAWYKKQLQEYGLPLDSRTKLSKSDWTVWSATLADNQADFETLVDPIVKYLNGTTAHVPFADSYITNDIHSDGMHARPVIGGVFIKLLADRELWKKWSTGDNSKPSNWAPVPPPPQVTEVLPTARNVPSAWLYTIDKPSDDTWIKPDFDVTGWKSGLSGFGTQGTPGAVIGTEWKTADIWIRREFTVPDAVKDTPGELQFLVNHDEDVDIYVNGIFAANEPGFTGGYAPIPMTETAKAILQPGKKVLLAVHCHQTEGGQVIDVGLAKVVEAGE